MLWLFPSIKESNMDPLQSSALFLKPIIKQMLPLLMQLIVKEGSCFLGILGIWKKPMKSMILMTIVPMQPIPLSKKKKSLSIIFIREKISKGQLAIK